MEMSVGGWAEKCPISLNQCEKWGTRIGQSV
jgi:hypothetical protein